MPKFLVVHKPFPIPISPEEAAPILKRAASSMTADPTGFQVFAKPTQREKPSKYIVDGME